MANLKERFLRGASAAIILGSTLGTACTDSNSVRPTETRPVVSGIVRSNAETTWDSSPPVERLKRLEVKSFPSIREFDLNKEISLATAQFYCEQTKCNNPPEQMAASVLFVDENEFFQKLEIDIQRKYSAEDLNKEKEKQLAFTTKNKDAIYINQTLLEKIIQELNASQPELAKQLGNKDLIIIIKKSLLVHEFAHKNLLPQSKTFPAFLIHLPGNDQSINFGQLYGFEISGKSQDGKTVFYITGGDEAITERATQIIAENSRSYIGLIPEYTSGASFVNQLNAKSEIANNEFLKYASGELPSEELIKKWGKGDFKKGLMVLAAIGLNAQGLTSVKETQGFIDDILKSS